MSSEFLNCWLECSNRIRKTQPQRRHSEKLRPLFSFTFPRVEFRSTSVLNRPKYVFIMPLYTVYSSSSNSNEIARNGKKKKKEEKEKGRKKEEKNRIISRVYNSVKRENWDLVNESRNNHFHDQRRMKIASRITPSDIDFKSMPYERAVNRVEGVGYDY